MNLKDHKSCLFMFHDDSSLISAVAMARLLKPYGFFSYFGWVLDAKRPALSHRQIELYLGRQPDAINSATSYLRPNFLEQFDFVYSAKYTRIIREYLSQRRWHNFKRRPVFISTFPGLELLPDLGMRLRSLADVLCVNSVNDFELMSNTRDLADRYLVRFNPVFFSNKKPPHPPQSVRNLLFLPQNSIPLHRRGRESIASLLKEIINQNTSTRVCIKFRNELHEDRFHTHKEYISYSKILSDIGCIDKFSFSSESIDKIIKDFDAVLTCSSSGGIEAMVKGTSAAFYIDYPTANSEPQYDGTKRLLQNSNLVISRQEVTSLSMPTVDTSWWNDNVSGNDQLIELLKVMEKATKAIRYGGLKK